MQLFTSHDGGNSWSAPLSMNGGLTYMDKPILVISPSGRDVYVAFNHKFDNMVVASHDYGQSFLPRLEPGGRAHRIRAREKGTERAFAGAYYDHSSGPCRRD